MSNKREVKVMFLGESQVGKTSLINRICYDKFKEDGISTKSVYLSVKSIKYKEKDYYFFLWDTPGKEEFRSLIKQSLKDVKIFILVYDITKKKSFLELQFWLDYILENNGPQSFIILLGNKSDLISNKEINISDGEKFAKIIKANFILVSAKDKSNWMQTFENILTDYLKIKENEQDEEYKEDEEKKDDETKMLPEVSPDTLYLANPSDGFYL